MTKPRLLDLYCGAGGASAGYAQAGFNVTGVDHKPQPHYPFEFHQADALEFLKNHSEPYSVIHASPPCQKYTGMRAITRARFGQIRTNPNPPDLIAATRRALAATGKVWIIENVQGSPLRTGIILCGASFGLEHLARHRHFESNVLLFALPCRHYSNSYTIGVYGSRPDARRVSYKGHRLCRIAASLKEARQVMGIHWMDWHEITQAVPPAYTRFIGHQLMQSLQHVI